MIAEAIYCVVIYQAHGLHESIHDGQEMALAGKNVKL